VLEERRGRGREVLLTLGCFALYIAISKPFNTDKIKTTPSTHHT
jgi:hypothetical protein